MKIRLYCPVVLHEGSLIELDAGQCNYLKNVMRLKLSDIVHVFNGEDGEWECEITELEKKRSSLIAVKQSRQQKQEPDIWLAFAPIKHRKIDFLAQKATELGVSRLMPVFTRRTIASKVNTDRLHSNAVEAAEQCERLSIPDVTKPQKLTKLLDEWPKERKLIVCDETGGGKPVRAVLGNADASSSWAILVGPEGGFSEEELALLRKLPYVVPVGLGPRILRADTAAIAALTCWQEHLGDWNEHPKFKSR